MNEIEAVGTTLKDTGAKSKSRKSDLGSGPKSMLTNIAPPSALPSFVTAPPLQTDSPEPKADSSEKSPVSAPFLPSTSSSDKSLSSINSEVCPIVSPVTQSLSSDSLVTSQPRIPDSVSPELVKSAKIVSSNGKKIESLSPSQENDGWLGWIKGTVQTVGTKVAEKAKTSMDNMITTLDPQMREFINSGGDIDIIVASDKEVKISPVREAFQKKFGKATVSGFTSHCEEMANQPVGFSPALLAARGRIDFLRSSGQIHPQQPVIAIEGFIVELIEEVWVEMSLLLLDDPWHDIILQTYSQGIPIPPSFVEECKAATPDNYPLRDSGFALTIGEVAAKDLRIAPPMWQENICGVSRRETLLLAARVLAGLYEARLPKDVL